MTAKKPVFRLIVVLLILVITVVPIAVIYAIRLLPNEKAAPPKATSNVPEINETAYKQAVSIMAKKRPAQDLVTIPATSSGQLKFGKADPFAP